MPKTRKLLQTQGTRKSKRKSSQLFETYGKLLLKKGTILYHTNSKPFVVRKDKPMLFLSLHPSEWHNSNESYVASIELKRDITLLFMIQEIRNVRVFSALNLFSGNNMSKTQNDSLNVYVNKLNEEGFDGWFSSIENGSSVEVAIVNDPSIYSVRCCDRLEFNWKNTNYNNNGLVPKQWGSKYPISSQTIPIELDIHERFRDKIDKYIEMMHRNEPYGTAFSILLDNAHIKYHSGKIHNVKWV